MNRLIALLAALVCTVGAFKSPPAVAETVRFPTAVTPPTPLQQRLARERGQPIAAQPVEDITGELHRPTGNGPFPAVLLLHGCSGRGPRANEDAAAAKFTALGYAALIVDSFSSRDVKQRCSDEGPPVDRLMDAYGALLYMAALPFIDPDRIAVVGYSQGGGVVLSAVALDGTEGLFDRHFRAAVAYYPSSCSSATGAVAVPTLILTGELDDWTPARDCRAMMTQRSGQGAPLKLVVYPGAYHAFNATSLRDRPLTYMGHHLEYNEAVDHAAWQETVSALRQAFGK